MAREITKALIETDKIIDDSIFDIALKVKNYDYICFMIDLVEFQIITWMQDVKT